MSKKKSFFDSQEWQAFTKPFKLLLDAFKNKSENKTPPKTPVDKPDSTETSTVSISKTNTEQQESLQKQDKEREELLLSKFERRKLEREQRKQNAGSLEETVFDSERPSLEADFEEYSLEDFMETESAVEEEGTNVREIHLPENGFNLPTAEMLNEVPEKAAVNKDEIEKNKNLLQDTLDSFRIDAHVSGAVQGPRITRYEIKPAQGVNVDSIAALSKNMAMELEAESLRILAPVPGKAHVGVEIPNSKPLKVTFRELIESDTWNQEDVKLPLALGRNTSGEIRVLDLSKAPHLLIAGATGAGKSVCINTIIISMVFRFSPEDLELIMVDPKVVELTAYRNLPHLIAPVITEAAKVPSMLKWVVAEMKRRYRILALAGVRNIDSYNTRENSDTEIFDEDGIPIPPKLPLTVIVIDELADIMMTAGVEVEKSLAQIAQLSRAVGIHTVIATQRPSVNVITGIIKANYPTRIAFKVSSIVDSRTIIDGKGAEQLLGRGDMLLMPPGAAVLERLQGAILDDDEIDQCVEFLAGQMQQVFDPGLEAILTGDFDNSGSGEGGVDVDDKLLKEAMDIIARDRKASTSYIQRRLRIGYNRAANIMEKLEGMGVVGPQIGSSPREIFIE